MEIRRADAISFLQNPGSTEPSAPAPPAVAGNEHDFGRDRATISAKKSTRTAPKPDNDCNCVINQAEKIARKVMTRNTHRVSLEGRPGKLDVLTAGSDHFEALWTRDACFGSLGFMQPGKPARPVRDSLTALFSRMRPDGEMPRRLGDFDNKWMVAGSALHIKLPDPKQLDEIDYRNERGAYQFDANALPIIVAEEYARNTGDMEFIRQHYHQLSQAADWLEKMDESRLEVPEGEVGVKLINQPPSGDWKDVVGREGIIAYTNAVNYQAHKSMAEIDRLMGNTDKAAHRDKFAGRLKADFNRRLWDEKNGYYRDAENNQVFSPDGNILAVIYGLADQQQADSIFKKFEEMSKDHPLPFPATGQEYPDSYIPIWLKLAGMEHYHDRMVWPWQGAALAVAAARTGRTEVARQMLAEVGQAAIRDGTFYEIYTPDRDPKPVHTWAYHSEPDFLWGAGTYLWAVKELREAESRA